MATRSLKHLTSLQGSKLIQKIARFYLTHYQIWAQFPNFQTDFFDVFFELFPLVDIRAQTEIFLMIIQYFDVTAVFEPRLFEMISIFLENSNLQISKSCLNLLFVFLYHFPQETLFLEFVEEISDQLSELATNQDPEIASIAEQFCNEFKLIDQSA